MTFYPYCAILARSCKIALNFENLEAKMKKVLIILILVAGALFILSGVFSHEASKDYLEAAQKWAETGNTSNSNMYIAIAHSHSAVGNQNIVIGIVLVVAGLGIMIWSFKKNK